MPSQGSDAGRRSGELRASDADREQAVGLLRDHFGAGRLSQSEFSERVDAAYGSSTLSELARLTRDLPGAELSRPAAARPPATRRTVTRGGRALRASLRIHLVIFVLVNALLIGIWAAAGGGYFWPIWSILGWGMGVAGHAAPVLAGAGTRRLPPPSPADAESIGEIAATVDSERPDLRGVAAPDGTVTILFSDVAGSTELNERLGDLRWLELLRAHHAVVREQVKAHEGFEVKAQGDGFMIAFASARRAVLCARGIQQAIDSTLGEHPDGPLRVRIGLHTGEAIKEENDFYGRNVVLAARIAEHARAGEILASVVVRQLTESAGDVQFEEEREVELKSLGTQTVCRISPTSM